ncbi:MAG TPA: phytoene desaturase family protein [Bacteroidales bacterium]|nr:phytoene desaturase family protein [Bacteroidales bacterium]
MDYNRSAIIIGSGIGGITTSIYLAQKGYRVNIYEKNSSPGGRCGQILRDGHRFDLGATMMLMPDTYREVFSSLGLKLEETLNVKPLDDIYTVYFDDGSRIAFTTDQKRMEEQLEKIEQGSFLKEREYVKTGFRLYKLSFEKLIGRNFFRFFDFFNLSNALLLIRLKTYLKHSRYTARFFSDKHLQMAYTFQNIYVGQSPFKAPALFSMIPAAELTEGSLFPVGGMYSVVEKLMGVAKGLGVEFHFDMPVSKITTGKGRASGVVFDDGSLATADVIIANADLPYVYRELLPPSWKSHRIERMTYSCSALALHWGLDKRYSQLGQHSVFLSDNFRNGLDTIFKEKSMGSDPSFYIHAPACNDPSAAPEGGESLSVVVGVGHLDNKKPQDWDHLRDVARKAVFKRLKEMGISDIEEHIKFEICAPPPSWEEAFNITHGSVFGSLGHNIFQMGWFRPHNRDSCYKNLYFTGGSTHPGNGIPMVLLSAKLVSERIFKDADHSV